MFEALIPLFPGGVPGGTELVVILLIAVLLFGANKIPKLARSTGQAMGEFQKGREQVEQELEELQEGATIDEEGNVIDDGTPSTSSTSTSSTDTSSTDTSSTDTSSTDTSTESSTETSTESSAE